MNKAHQIIDWKDYPLTDTPVCADNLNAEDTAIDEIDNRVITLDTTKADQTDLLACVKTITYNTSTGVFVFTWQNGTTLTVDLNVEKIPVAFSMSPQGVITMTNSDGTTYSCDISTLIKTYNFTDTSEFAWTDTIDSSGNHHISAAIKNGSINENKLQTNFLADCRLAKAGAEAAQDGAEDSAEDSEAWAVGTRGGTPVSSSDPTYHNNSKWYSEQAAVTSLSGLNDVELTNPDDGDVLVYDANLEKWINGVGGGSSAYYGTCSTARDVLNKTVVCQDFSLSVGAMISVRFTDTGSTNPASGVHTLNVNNTGAKTMKFKTTYGDVTYASGNQFISNATVIFIYDGTNWVMYNDNNTTYTPPALGFGYGTCTTASATTAKVATLANYKLAVGGFVSIKFTNAVTIANATLNINSTGAKPIFRHGSALAANVISANEIVTFVYDGTNYNIVGFDTKYDIHRNGTTLVINTI